MRLLADRGVYLPDQQLLMIADTHFGKEATFRYHGIPVPSGSTNGTLRSVGRMLTMTGANRLIILGDMFHAKSSLSRDVVENLETFFTEQRGVRITLVRGNHDVHVGPLPESWPIEVVPPGTRMDPFSVGHHPSPPAPGSGLLFCGHVHPAIRLHGAGERLGKLPCFWWSKGCMILPAIGEFTGTHSVRPTGADRVWVVADHEVIEWRN